MSSKYQIYTGYVRNPNPSIYYADKTSQEFFEIWYKNTRKYSNARINIVGPDIPFYTESDTEERGIYWDIMSVAAYENFGGCGEYVTKCRFGQWEGWSVGVMVGLMEAYCQRVDFLYKESDCLAFGNYIDLMYNEIGDGTAIFGNYFGQPVANSLFLVPWKHIPTVMHTFTKTKDAGRTMAEETCGEIPNIKKMSIGYDRDRPFNIDPIFYIQHITNEDYVRLEGANIL